jgi:hypothetical protein
VTVHPGHPPDLGVAFELSADVAVVTLGSRHSHPLPLKVSQPGSELERRGCGLVPGCLFRETAQGRRLARSQNREMRHPSAHDLERGSG